MLGALLYLRFTSLKNLLLSRVRRLRQPKYLVGAIVGAAYFYLMFFRRMARGHNPTAPQIMGPAAQMVPHDIAPLMLALGALALLVVIIFMWILPSQKPGLAFSEAETAFLFPAPVTRRALIHYKLLSSQLSVLLQSLFFSLIFNSRGLASNRAGHVLVGWWLILTLVNLHYMGSSLTLARLIERGVSVGRRRLVVLGSILIVLVTTIGWTWRSVHAPSAADLAGVEPLMRWLLSALDGGLLHWVLFPFKLILAPFFATDVREFLIALIPAFLLLAAHYFWVLHMEVSFEEASIAQAERRSARRASIRSGNYRIGRTASKARRPAFALASTGKPEIAFLWKNLLSTRSFFTVRNWFICAGIVILGSRIVSGFGKPQQAALSAIGIGVTLLNLYVLAFGPLIARLDLRADLANADVLKTYPLAGWRIVLGELLAPVTILTGIIWLGLLTSICAIQSTLPLPNWLAPDLRMSYALCFAALTPPLVALQLLVPNAAAIVFPAWFQATRTRGGGIDLTGQRLIFVFGQIFIILVALIPAALTAAILIFVTQWLIGLMLATIFATLVILLVIVGEVWCGLWWLGGRFERFDLSAEQRP